MTAKVALVTGGARGIGLGIAERLSRLGYEVAVADVIPSETEFFLVRCDVSREAAVKACVRKVLQRFGRLDALVNNAGLAGPQDPPITRLPLARWRRTARARRAWSA